MAKVQFSPLLTCMGIKQFNGAAHLDVAHIIRLQFISIFYFLYCHFWRVVTLIHANKAYTVFQLFMFNSILLQVCIVWLVYILHIWALQLFLAHYCHLQYLSFIVLGIATFTIIFVCVNMIYSISNHSISKYHVGYSQIWNFVIKRNTVLKIVIFGHKLFINHIM